MLAVHGNETDREIELEGCPETHLTNVTLIKSRPLAAPKEEKRVSLLERRHHSRVFSLTFIIQGIVLCSQGTAVASCGAVHDVILIRAKMSLLVSPEFIILIMAPRACTLAHDRTCLHARGNM